jgi:hypothetical protein
MKLWTLLIALTLTFTLGFAVAEDDGYIKARGKPGRAGIFVDGKFVGPAVRFSVPEKYAVAPGDHEVTFKDPRYEDFTTKVTVQPKKTSKLSFKLKLIEPPKPPFGRLRFGGGASESFISVAGGDATSPVMLNGKFYGYIDEMNNAGGGLLLPPGTYRLTCSSRLYGEINQDVTIVANKVTIVPLSKK